MLFYVSISDILTILYINDNIFSKKYKEYMHLKDYSTRIREFFIRNL